MEDNLLSGREVLDEIYKLFETTSKIINFDEKTKVVIAGNPDDHHEGKSYSQYDSLILYSPETSRWIISLGIGCGEHPANFYDRDLFLRKLDDASNMTPEKDIDRAKGLLTRNESHYFSALYSLEDGTIGINDFAFKGKLTLAEDLINFYNIQPTEASQGVMPFGSTPTTFKQAKYDSKLPILIFEQFIAILD